MSGPTIRMLKGDEKKKLKEEDNPVKRRQ